MYTATIIALSYLAARKLRTVFTTVAVVFGVAVIFAGNLVLPSVIDAFRRTTLGAAGAVDLTIAQTSGAAFSPNAALDTVRAVDGVAAATGVLQRAIPIPISASENGQVTIVGVDPTTISAVRQINIAEGRALAQGDSGVVVLGDDSIKLGGTIRLPTTSGLREYTVIGRLDTPGGLPSSEVLMTLADAQTALDVPEQISAVEIALQPRTDRVQAEAAVLAALGQGYRVGASSAVDASGSLDIAYAMFNMLGALALFIGAFLIFNTFRTIVLERRRDLAMLRAIGAERGQITRILLVESLLQGVFGSLLGLVVGGLFALGMLKALESLGTRFLPGFAATPEFSPTAALPALAAGIITTLVAGYLPARAAGRVSPLEAMRPASVADSRRTARWNLIIGLGLVVLSIGLLFAGPRAATGGALLFLVGLAIATPSLIAPAARLFAPLLSGGFAAEGDIAQGNLVRQPGRAAVTASTLMIGLAAMVMIASVIGSFGVFISNMYNKNLVSDIVLLPQNLSMISSNLGASGKLADEIRTIPGVAAVGSLRSTTGSVGNQTINVLGIDSANYPLVSPLTFESGEAATAFAGLEQNRGAIANPIFAANSGLKIGDEVTVVGATGPQRYTITGIGGDPLNFKINTIFISQNNLAQDFGKRDDVMIMLNVDDNADLAAVEQQVTAAAAAYPQFTIRVTADLRQELIDLTLNAMNAAFVPLALVILLPAALGLLNTLTMSVLERTREIGITRAIGASQSQVRRIVVAEALLLGLLGAAMGALAGLAMSFGFTAALGSAFGTTLPFSLPLFGLVAALVLGLGVTLLASALPARSAARLDILQSLRYE